MSWSLQVTAVERSRESEPGALRGFSIDRPAPGYHAEGGALVVEGWVLGESAPISEVEMVQGESLLRRSPAGLPRPDVAVAFPEVGGAHRSGFRLVLPLLGETRGEVAVRARLDDSGSVVLARIRFEQRQREPGSGEERKALVLLYHRLADGSPDPWELAVRPAHFEEHLEVLARYGRVVRLEELWTGGGDGGEPVVAITFDDAYQDVAITGAPLLERYRLPATVFVPTDYLGRREEFWWDELEGLVLSSRALPASLELEIGGSVVRWERGGGNPPVPPEGARNPGPETTRGSADQPATGRQELYSLLWSRLRSLDPTSRRRAIDKLRRWTGRHDEPRPGFRCMTKEEARKVTETGLVRLGAHTRSHPVLATLPEEEQWLEIRGSKESLERLTGGPVASFAYPYGKPADYSSTTTGLVRRAGFERACCSHPGVARPEDDPLLTPRIFVGDWSGEELVHWLAPYFAS